MKFFFTIFIFLTFSHVAGATPREPTSKCVVGYGYTTNVFSMERQERCFIGFKYGLKQGFTNLPEKNGPCTKYSDVKLLIKTDHSGRPLGAMQVAQNLVNDGAIILAGFPSSHEALLATKIAKENHMAILLAASSAQSLTKYKDYFFSTSPGRLVYIKIMLEHYNQKYANKKILVVVKKDNIYSVDIFKGLKEAPGSIKFIPIYLNQDLLIDKKDLNPKAIQGVAAIFFTAYATESKRAFLQLSQLFKENVTYYAASSWFSMDRTAIQDILQQDKQKFYVYAGLIPDFTKTKPNQFAESYKTEHGHYPLPETVSGFVLGYFSSHVLYNSNTNSKKSLLNSLQTIPCVNIPWGRALCRTPEGFAKNTGTWYQWGDKGWHALASHF